MLNKTFSISYILVTAKILFGMYIITPCAYNSLSILTNNVYIINTKSFILHSWIGAVIAVIVKQKLS